MINSSNTIHFVCDLGLQSHHAVDVIGLHGLVWSEGSETSVSYDLLLLLPGTFALFAHGRQNMQTGTSSCPAAWTDRMNHDPGTDLCLTVVVPAWVRPLRPQAGRVEFPVIHGSTHVYRPADSLTRNPSRMENR